MATLYHEHRLNSKNPGVTHSDIKKALVNTTGGRRLGTMLDELVSNRKAPDVEAAFATLGLELEREKEQKGAWIGLNLVDSTNKTKVRTHLTGSPCRELIHTGDEIVAIDGLRVNSSKAINAAIYGKQDTPIKITIARQGVLREVDITPISNPEHNVKVKGKGNKLWKIISSSKR